MFYRTILNTSLKVSVLGLGTMTFGQQNNEYDAHNQLNYAIEKGINFIDTAEMYPVPSSKEKQGVTETYIGNWIKKFNKRKDIILASKVMGPLRSKNDIAIRKNQKLDKKNIQQALEGSLRRLKTDYLDLYQIHWPQRSTNCFGKLNYSFSDEKVSVSILETLEVLHNVVKSGKVRYIGISNETPWGTMQYLHLSEKYGLSKIVTIQNPYNLLNRSFEVGMAEISHREKIGLIAYSALGFGTLTGKYLNNNRPIGARNTLFKRFNRYSNFYAEKAIKSYVELSDYYGINPAQMALSFVRMQPFVISTLLGATNLAQLKTNIDSLKINLNEDILSSLEKIHLCYTFPCP